MHLVICKRTGGMEGTERKRKDGGRVDALSLVLYVDDECCTEDQIDHPFHVVLKQSWT